VVAKLLALVTPDTLLLGQKDAQQLVLLRRMVRDLNLDVDVVGCPIRREPDGLALSSRNVYLSSAERHSALGLSRALRAAASRFAAGERGGPALRQSMLAALTADPALRLDYAEVVDLDQLEPLAVVVDRALLAVAAFAGRTRLIDNVMVDAGAPSAEESSC
jgi:pantoate--beta-alanine ligase